MLEQKGVNLRFDALDVLRDVDQCGNMNSELAKNRANDVKVEDIVLRSLFGQLFDRL